MPNINIRNLPNDLYEKVKELAFLNKRSINNEIVYVLTEALELKEIHLKNENGILDKILKKRKLVKKNKYVDPVKLIRKMRDEG